MQHKLVLIFILLLSCGCLSYKDLQEMKLELSKVQAKENLIELIEVLEEPCDDPHFYSHVMETASFLRKGLILERGLNERYDNAFDNILRSFDLSESDDWEVTDIDKEREYLQALALQLTVNRKKSIDSSSVIKKYLTLRQFFTIEQCLIYSKAVEENREELKKDHQFCNDYINSLFLVKHHFSNEEKKFFATQMDYLLNKESAYLFRSFRRIYNVDKNCLNSLLEYAYEEGFEFLGKYSLEMLLKDLASFEFKDSYQVKLRNNLYLKYLNFRKMNSLIRDHLNVDILKLNEQLLAYTIGKDFSWDKEAFQNNIDLLTELSRKETGLGLKAKEMLIGIAPGLYGLWLIEREPSNQIFEDVLSLYHTITKHAPFFDEKDHYYKYKGRNYINPYFHSSKKSETELLLKNYIFRMTQFFASSFLESNAQQLGTITLSLQAYKLANMDVFTGKYEQVKLLQEIIGKGQKKIDQTLVTYLLNLSEKNTLGLLLDYLQKRNFKVHQLMLFVNLYEHTKATNKILFRESFSSFLQQRANNKSDEISLHAIKLAFRLDFMNNEFKKIFHVRWPELKGLRGDK